MGCHTWFSVPFITDKEKIKQDALEELNRVEYPYTEQEKKMYKYAIKQDLDQIIAEIACSKYYKLHTKAVSGIIYIDANDAEVERYNKENNINLNRFDNYKDVQNLNLKFWGNAFRCAGYPKIILRSLKETIDFINTYEFTDDDGNIHKCETSEHTIPTITEFFEKYPDGIITFG